MGQTYLVTAYTLLWVLPADTAKLKQLPNSLWENVNVMSLDINMCNACGCRDVISRAYALMKCSLKLLRYSLFYLLLRSYSTCINVLACKVKQSTQVKKTSCNMNAKTSMDSLILHIGQRKIPEIAVLPSSLYISVLQSSSPNPC